MQVGWAHLNGGLTGLSRGFPLALYMFIGWEKGPALAEECRDPKRAVPQALYISIAIGAALFVFFAYAAAGPLRPTTWPGSRSTAATRKPVTAMTQPGTKGWALAASPEKPRPAGCRTTFKIDQAGAPERLLTCPSGPKRRFGVTP